MHIDSQRSTPQGAESGAASDELSARFELFGLSSSRDSRSNADAIPFTDRMRAGMVVVWEAPAKLRFGSDDSINMVVVLCPATAFGPDLAHAAIETDDAEERESLEAGTFICALVSPGVLRDSYTVDLWRQILVKKSQMKAEVILEYDSATRYYYITI